MWLDSKNYKTNTQNNSTSGSFEGSLLANITVKYLDSVSTTNDYAAFQAKQQISSNPRKQSYFGTLQQQAWYFLKEKRKTQASYFFSFSSQPTSTFFSFQQVSPPFLSFPSFSQSNSTTNKKAFSSFFPFHFSPSQASV